MDKLHKKLMQQSPLYARFHKHRGLQLIQWLVLVLVIVGFSALIYHRVTDLRGKSYGLNSKADQVAGQEDFSGITAELLNQAHNYQKASPEEQANLKISLEQLAQQRKQAMLDALDDNPKAVARASIAPGLLKKMPAEISSFLEQPATIEGTAEVLDSDNFDQKRSETDLYVTGGNHVKYHVRTTDSLGKITTGSQVKITGTTLNDNLIPDDSTTSMTITAQAAASSTTQKKVAMILFNFQDNTLVESSQDDTRAKMFTNPDSVNKYYQENSFGQWELVGSLRPDGDVFGYYTIPYSQTVCDTNNWASAADAKATKDGFNPANYNSILYLFPETSSCPWAGRSSLGGSPGRSWLNTGTFNTGVTAHELGHQFDFEHSSALYCQDSAGNHVTFSNNCTADEYGDPYDVMGTTALFHVNNFHKGQVGPYAPNSWIPTANTVSITSGQSGTYTLAPMEYATSGIQTIRIPKVYSINGRTPYSGYYYLEYRQPYGFDNFDPNISYDPLINGVIIRLARSFDNDGENTYLLDATPETTSRNDAPLPAGRTFTDSTSGITITVNSISAASAVVSITTTAQPCTQANPSISISPTTQSAPAGGTLTYTYTLINNDSSNCPSSTFNIKPSVNQSSFFYSPASLTETLAPGASVTRAFNVTAASTLAPNSYPVGYFATNSANSTYTANTNALFVVTSSGGGGTGDTINPTVSITSPASGATVKAKSNVTIAAQASDNVAVRSVTIYVGGKVLCTDSTAPYTCGWPVPAGKKSYQLQALATDTSGNSTFSTTITVKSQ